MSQPPADTESGTAGSTTTGDETGGSLGIAGLKGVGQVKA